MASEGPLRRSSFTLGVAVRAAATAALTFAAIILAWRSLYASALVALLLTGLTVWDLRRAVARADADVGRFLESLGSESPELPARMPRDFEAFAGAAKGALARIKSGRAERERQIDWLRGLIDTVSAALVIIEPGDNLVLANRAARKLAGPRGRAKGLDLKGLSALPPGGRSILRLGSGEQVLASVSRFAPFGGEPCRLIALQRVSGELDAVEQKAWRDLVRILAHEMMNSLTPIVSLSESLAERADGDPETAEALEVIARRASGLMAFVERYRALAELPRPILKPVKLAELLGGIEALLKAEIAQRGVAYSVSVEPAELTVSADRELLEQAVLNLVKNGLEAAGPKAPAVALRCRREEEGTVIEVADNGPGVDEAARETIFIPFFTTRPGGSGVGLSLARQIALSHGGRIEVASEPGGGARFRLALPG